MSKSQQVWINGKLMPADEVRVSPFDLGLSVGLGVFETMLACDGEVAMYPEHYQRLTAGAETIGGINLPAQDTVSQAISEVLHANELTTQKSRVRVSVSGGVNPLSGGEETGNTIVTAVAIDQSANTTKAAQIAKLIQSPYLIDEKSPLSRVKSASYAMRVIAYRHALAEGADEALVYNQQGSLAEATMSNVFIQKDGTLYTPFLHSGCLAGVTRAAIIDLAAKLRISLVETSLRPIDVKRADEIFITSSIRGVQQAVLLGEKEQPAPITEQLAHAYQSMIKSRLSAG